MTLQERERAVGWARKIEKLARDTRIAMSAGAQYRGELFRLISDSAEFADALEAGMAIGCRLWIRNMRRSVGYILASGRNSFDDYERAMDDMEACDEMVTMLAISCGMEDDE